MPTKSKLYRPAHNAPHLRERRERERKAKIDAQREQAHKRGYDWDWRRLRAKHLKAHPACIWCGSKDRLHVDHIKTIAEHPELRLEPSNLRTLCHPCHSSHTAKEQGFAKRGTKA